MIVNIKADTGNGFIEANGETFIKIDKARRDYRFTSELSPDQNDDNNLKMKIDEYGDVYFDDVFYIPATILSKVGFYASLDDMNISNPSDHTLRLYITMGDLRKNLDYDGQDGWLEEGCVQDARSSYTLKELFIMSIETTKSNLEDIKKLRENVMETFDTALKEYDNQEKVK